MQVNWISNGLGGQSMYMLYLAAQRIIPATLAITADTGSENDRVTNTGERITAPAFFQRYVRPYAEAFGIEAVMVRAQDKMGQSLPALIDRVKSASGRESKDFSSLTSNLGVPLFTNDRTSGRLKQSCTDKWKLRAIRQEARRRGVTHLESAIGFHAGEAHRIKAEWQCTQGGWNYYRGYTKRKSKLVPVKWMTQYYPLIDLRLNREQVREALEKEGIPYLVTTECDMCPHQDYQRWQMHTPAVLREIAEIEAGFDGKLFFTDRRVPLLNALEQMRAEKNNQHSLDFGCDSGGYCGI